MRSSTVEARRLADRAVSLWERLGHPDDGTSSSGGASKQVVQRVNRWQDVVAKGDPQAFQRRLAWDGLTTTRVEAALARAEAFEAAAPTVPTAPTALSPPWLETFVDLIRSVEEDRLHPPGAVSDDHDQPRPFEDVLLPLIHAARRRLHRRMETYPSPFAGSPGRLLRDTASRSLEMGLLDRLCRVCAPSLQAEFSEFRPAGHGLLNALVGATEGASTRHYDAFVGHLLSANLMPIFEKYPVLARLVALVVEQWVTTCVEFQLSLREDASLIEECFEEVEGGPFGEVVQLRFGLSDSHRQGRCVMKVTFSSGLSLAYKPKSLGIDRAFHQLVEWCNRQGLALDLKPVRTLDRGDHGWMEWLEQRPCADEEEAGHFYWRAGMLLALLHALRGTDCHYENVVAHGGQPVMVDLETLMVPDLDVTSGLPDPVPDETFWQSVVRTGMLPHWETRLDPSIACDISALGGVGSQQTPTQVANWKGINTDDMDLYFESIPLPPQGNAAVLHGAVVSPGEHIHDLVGGFREMYRLLLRQRAALLAANGPLGAFRSQPVRYVFRPTEQYGQILRHSLAPEYLENGCDRSIELDHLCRGFASERERTSAWPLLGAERQALEELDIPRFDVLADGTALGCGGQVLAPHFFRASGYSKVVERIESLSEADLAVQTRIIEASLHAWRARSEKHVDPDLGRGGPLKDAPAGLTAAEHRRGFLLAAKAIADTVVSSAMNNPDGSLSWIGLAHLPKIGRYELQPVSDGLYGGRSGIALFLAACDHVNGTETFRPTIDRALQPLLGRLRRREALTRDDFVRSVGIGVAEGIGGLVYALSCIGGWWQDPLLQDDADLLARAVSPEVLEADRELDVIGGAAGAILGLMKLYRLRPSPAVLGAARDCAGRLLGHQRSRGEAAGGWDSVSSPRPLTGFSHGASGTAYALTQLYSVTHEPRFLVAAQAAVEFERSAFVPEAGNWIDFRRAEPGMPPCFATSWCHGAPGIALARLALLPHLQHPMLTPDLDAALATTQRPGSETVDEACCGSFGRFDILLHAAKVLGRSDLAAVAAGQAWETLCRSQAFRMFPTDVPEACSPGYFDGLAGIGYVLLRLAAPDALPSVLAWE